MALKIDQIHVGQEVIIVGVKDCDEDHNDSLRKTDIGKKVVAWSSDIEEEYNRGVYDYNRFKHIEPDIVLFPRDVDADLIKFYDVEDYGEYQESKRIENLKVFEDFI